jgi:3-dehydroquinate dehydratase-1
MDFESFRLAAATVDLADEPDARAAADLVEFRMDLADDPVAALDAYDGELPLLVTNRAAWEGGEATDDEQRLDALEAALDDESVVAVDVELASLEDGSGQHVVDRARERGITVVVSTHDFETTPARETMRETLRTACEYGDVGKLAVTASTVDDVLDLLAVTRALTAAGETVATMAMGEAGRHSRAVAPLYGSRIGYAPVDPAEATAPGQYDLRTLADLIGTLRSRE